MSSNMYRNQLVQLQKEKAKLEGDLATERTRLAKLQKEMATIQTVLSTTKSESTRRTKQREFLSKQDQIVNTQKKIADLEKKIAEKIGAINQRVKSLTSAEENEGKKRREVELRHLEDVNAEIEQQIALENTRQATRLITGRQGKSLKLSQEAKVAAKQLLEMFERKELEKESHLSANFTFGGRGVKLFRPAGRQWADFLIPIADIKELAAYGLLSLQEKRSKGQVSGWNMLLLPERLREVVTGRILPDVFRVFYSWQSWTPGNINRHFILEALENAVEEIRDDETIEVEPVVDRDTLGEPGSVDIVATIFGKIENSAIFVCDATIITDSDAAHASPNPNVMVELGYAAAVLGWDRIICVVNTAYGQVEQLPFDLRARRMLTYHLPPNVESKAYTRKSLTKGLRGAIALVIDQISPTSDET